MTATIIIAIAAALAGYAIGRVQKFGQHIEHDFQQWRDRITAASLMPAAALEPPTIDLEAVHS